MDRTTSEERRIANLLEANVRAELKLRRAMLELVVAQERAVLDDRRDDLDAALRELEVLLARAAEPAAGRSRLLAQLGALWRIDARALTLGSVALRLGEHGRTLGELRGELREVLATLARRNRRLGALIALQRRIVRDVVGAVLGQPSGESLRDAGTVLCAEA